MDLVLQDHFERFTKAFIGTPCIFSSQWYHVIIWRKARIKDDILTSQTPCHYTTESFLEMIFSDQMTLTRKHETNWNRTIRLKVSQIFGGSDVPSFQWAVGLTVLESYNWRMGFFFNKIFVLSPNSIYI